MFLDLYFLRKVKIINILTIIAGFLAAFVVMGHFKMGIGWYLKPMLETDMELIPKTTMQSVFHYVSVFLSLSAIILLLIGFGVTFNTEVAIVVKFIGINYLLFAAVQVMYSFKNKVPKPLIAMFQWMMFLPIGILCLIA